MSGIFLAREDVLVVSGTGIKDGSLQRDGVGVVGVSHRPCGLVAADNSIIGVCDLLLVVLTAAARRNCHRQHDICGPLSHRPMQR